MSRANILNTTTINYQDLIGNGKTYRVPPYQRDYSWSDEQWEDLWNDIDELRTNPDGRHYMGALVVEGRSDRDFLIIDGQQRMATLSILALAVIDKLGKSADSGIDSSANRERAKELRDRFIGEKDPASLIEQSKLFLNETDNPFYQDYLIQLRPPLNPRGLPKSNRLLWDCFQYFRRRLEEVDELRSNGTALTKLLSETAARQLLFILITVDDDLNAYTVFETLNARGLELTTTDLLKNYLFSRIQVKTDLEALHRRWRALIGTIGQERFPEFLRYHLLCEQPKIRKQRLFKLVRERAKTPPDVFALLTALEARAELFTALSDTNHGYWSELPEAKPFVRELNLFRSRQVTPLLFAVWEKFTREHFVSVLRMVSVISFRYSTVSGLNPNALESAYPDAAKAVLDGSAGTVKAVFDRLKRIYVPDDKFQQDFASFSVETGGQRGKLAKYILSCLEKDAAGHAVDPDTDPGTIEHVLPENPSDDWEQFFRRELWEQAVYRLGNLTLLEASINRSVGNKAYREKVSAYPASVYQLTRDIVELAPTEWNLDLLNDRQQRLARRATHIWRADL